MKQIFALFKDDLKHLTKNIIGIITIIGLIVIPSIASWYNILACWDTFENTGYLSVAIANSDEGYESELIPANINVGQKVISAILENEQLDWIVTDEGDAVEGVKSGKYYAALVIPKEFSTDMMSFLTDDTQTASLIYFSNQKKNAVAPKVTDQGADQLSAQVNQVFAKTALEVLLGVSQTMLDYVESSGLDAEVQKLAKRTSELSDSLASLSENVDGYSATLESAVKIIDSSIDTVQAESDAIKEAQDAAASTKSSVKEARKSLKEAADALGTAIDSSADTLKETTALIESALELADESSDSAVSILRKEADALEKHAASYRESADKIDAVVALLPGDASSTTASKKLRESADTLDSAAEMLRGAADDIIAGKEYTAVLSKEVNGLLESAKKSVASAKTSYEETLKPQIDDLRDRMKATAENASDASDALISLSDDVAEDATSLKQVIKEAESHLEDASSRLVESSKELKALSAKLTNALTSGDVEEIKNLITNDPEQTASLMSAPVEMARTAVFPVGHFGSAMAPLYTTLSLWVGALLLMVTISVFLSRKQESRLGPISLRKQYLGRFGVISLISLGQSTLMGLGCIFFLGVQAAHPLLLMVVFWCSGLTFALVIYTLVALFANLGKAITVLLLIMQISGGGGSFPAVLLPQFFQDASPYLPVTHSVRAMREAMFGIYGSTFTTELMMLGVFAGVALLIGLAPRNLMNKIVHRFLEKVERSKIM